MNTTLQISTDPYTILICPRMTVPFLFHAGLTITSTTETYTIIFYGKEELQVGTPINPKQWKFLGILWLPVLTYSLFLTNES